MSDKQLRKSILLSIQKQGFALRDNLIVPPSTDDKDAIRLLHAEAVNARRERAASGLRRHESRLLTWIASGSEVDPRAVDPELVAVRAGSDEELLFRWAKLHWSIPVSAGYGRRLRFLVIDRSNGRLMGLIGLGDPVGALRPRDEWIGWSRAWRHERLRNVMEAFVLGAVPPYSCMLGGKLIAMLAASNEVRIAFRRKYGRGSSLIRERQADGRMALITTASALGRSSIYNRLRFGGNTIFHRVGLSSGSGYFHFSNGVYSSILDYAQNNLEPMAKHEKWGTGFRNRREIVRRTLADVGLPRDLVYHGVQREVFAVPLAKNAREFLRGEASRLHWHDRPLSDLFSEFRERWMLPRIQRDRAYLDFDPESYRIYTGRSH